MTEFFANHPLLPFLIIATAIIFIWLIRFAEDMKAKWYVVAFASIPMMTIGFLSCVGLAKLENLIAPSNQANIRMFGYILEFPFLTMLFAKIIKADLKVVWDVFSFTYSSSMIFGRIPCFIQGCCVGRVIQGTEIRWPIREVEMAICIAYSVYIVIRLMRNKRVYTGRLMPIFMVLYGGYRFVVEFIRQPDNYYFGIFDLAQVWALLRVIIGTVFLIWLRNKEPVIITTERKNNNRRKKKT